MNLRYPERLLQPWKDLRQFTQELYAMFRTGDERPGTEPGSPAPARAADRPGVVRRPPPARREFPTEGPRPRPEGAAPDAGPPKWETVARRVRNAESFRRPEAVVEARRREAAQPARLPEPERPRRVEVPRPGDEPRRRQAPAVEPERERPRPEPARDESRAKVDQIPYAPRPVEPLVAPPRADVLNVGADPEWVEPTWPIGGGGTTVFVGKVESGSGDTYQVKLYQDGPDGDPDDEPVEVTIPTIDPDEQIPADTWLFGIFQFTNDDGDFIYYAQPPIWMA
jgi:hypothetical protein